MNAMNEAVVITCILVFSSISCSKNDSLVEPIEKIVGTLSQDTISKWNSYVMSSMIPNANPMANQPEVRVTRVIGGEEYLDEEIPFYLSGYFASKGDTLFITDPSTEKLMAMDISGSTYWSIGGFGEGPGYFNGISRLDIIGESLLVCNNRNCRVDIISTGGDYLNSISILRPQGVVSVNDSLLVILSKQQPNVDCHVFNLNSDSFEYSFGDAPWHELLASNPSPGAVYGEYLPDSFIAYGAQEQTECYLYNIYTGEAVCSYRRQLPTEEFTPTMFDHNGSTTTVYVPMTSDLFVSADGNINIVFPTYLSNGHFMDPLASAYDFAPVTIVDTYSPEGDYLHSFSLPDSLVGEIEVLDDHRLLVRQLPTASLFVYEVSI